MEYTLEDTYETLKESKTEREKELENLYSILANNEAVTLNQSTSAEEVQEKQHRLCHSLLKQVLLEVPRDYPIPKTSDLHVQVVDELENEIRSMRALYDAMEKNLSDINKDISYLEKKKAGLESMKKAYLGATETDANKTYHTEHAMAKTLFKAAKADLRFVVETLFPGNEDFTDFLAMLSSAYTKGGDDSYVDVTPEVQPCVYFLINADLITYHRNDKNKVRLTDML